MNEILPALLEEPFEFHKAPSPRCPLAQPMLVLPRNSFVPEQQSSHIEDSKNVSHNIFNSPLKCSQSHKKLHVRTSDKTILPEFLSKLCLPLKE